jgi:hypothetical protein
MTLAQFDTFLDQHAIDIEHPAFGHAPWEPHPGEFPQVAVDVGDVGFIRDSKFHRLFNTIIHAIHPSHESHGTVSQSTTNHFSSA